MPDGIRAGCASCRWATNASDGVVKFGAAQIVRLRVLSADDQNLTAREETGGVMVSAGCDTPGERPATGGGVIKFRLGESVAVETTNHQNRAIREEGGGVVVCSQRSSNRQRLIRRP